MTEGAQSGKAALLLGSLLVIGALLTFLALNLADSGSGSGSGSGDGSGGGGGGGDRNDIAADGDGGGEVEGGDSSGPVTLRESLSFLPVLGQEPGACTSPQPPAVIDDPELRQCLTLDEGAGMSVTGLSQPADAEYNPVAGSWGVQIVLLDSDAERFGELTEVAATQPAPRNQIAMVLGEDRLLMAPAVSERLPGGQLEISGGFTRQEAEDIARQLGAR